jgi:hypothetical protein
MPPQYAAVMAYSAAEARQQLLDDLAGIIDVIGGALAALGAAYELLDEASGDRLEEELFRPVQVAYGRAQRTHSGFAERHGLPTRTFAPAGERAASAGVQGFVEEAADAIDDADAALVEMQDSMLPVEVGDPELRAGLADIRAHVDHLRERSRAFLRTLGR